MDCPACHAENGDEAVTCATCGRPLTGLSRSSRSRRRNNETYEAAAGDSDNPAAWRAFRVALWALMPGLGLLLGPLAVVLGYMAVRSAGEDAPARNRAKASILFGVLITLTQWLGITLIIHSWR
jgi:hypothetical protein